MPNPLLVVNPQSEEKKEVPLPVGTLLVKTWGNIKTVRNKVCKIVKVHKNTSGGSSWAYTYYRYDVVWLGGMIEKGVSQDQYVPFDEYRKRIEKNIQHTSKILNNQYQELTTSIELEKKAKSAFGVGE